MPYVIPWERTAERRGRRKGIEVGREEGLTQKGGRIGARPIRVRSPNSACQY
jgi:hypothetical protein